MATPKLAAKRRKAVSAEIRARKARQLDMRAERAIVRAVNVPTNAYRGMQFRGADLFAVIRAAITAAVPGRQKYPNIEKPLLDGVKAAAAAIRRHRRRESRDSQ